LSTRRPGSRYPTPTPAEPNGSDGQQQERNSVNLGPKDRLVGQLYIEGDLRVSGNVEGVLEATGDIEIAGAGKVSGAVTAYNRLVVGGGASLIGGDVHVARLTVEDGATFSGHVTMGKSAPKPMAAEPAPEPAAPAPEPQTEAIEAIAPVVLQPEAAKKGKRR
jgi:cytoskeletal protein CcmA (bactofilin family)